MVQQPLVLFQKIQTAAQAIREGCSLKAPSSLPEIGIILGSGLGSIADELEEPITLPYSEIPYFLRPAVEGHAGKLVVGKIMSTRVVILQGRFHRYEGYSMEEVAFPARTLCALGIRGLILTNAAGAINTRFRPGDLMLIEDQINLMGDNPLIGPHDNNLGARFVDQSEVYNRQLLNALKEAARELEISIHQGVYAATMGPAYETPAEVRMLRTLGADAVGMSTVPESIVASQMKVKVAGISCITNHAAGLSGSPLSHQEVIETSKMSSLKIRQLLKTSIPQITKLIQPHPSPSQGVSQGGTQ